MFSWLRCSRQVEEKFGEVALSPELLYVRHVFVDKSAGWAAANEVVVVGAYDLAAAFAADAWDEVEPAVLFFEFAGVVVEAFLFSFCDSLGG